MLETVAQLQNPAVKNMAKQRAQEMLQEPCFLAANLLDPRYFGQRLSAQQLREAMGFIKAANPLTEDALTQYIAKASPYEPGILGRNVNPGVWWTAGKRLGFDENLCQVAMMLVTAVANSAGLERQFSTMRATYGDLRQRLGVEKAGKITFCHRALHAWDMK